MSDRSGAYTFGFFFELLAKNPSDEHKAMARKVWNKARNFDFGDEDMDCDRALIKLGLARRGVDPTYPEEGLTMFYGPTK